MKQILTTLSVLFLFLPAIASAQTRASEFQVTKITKNLVSSPDYTFSGGPVHTTNEQLRWLEVEVEFTATPEFTDDLTFKYFILFNGKLLTGEVTHTNIAAGRENRSVMYLTPRTLARFNANRPVTPNLIQNITVQIVQQGAIKDELSLVRAQAEWYKTMPALTGFLLNKNETPFMPLAWDRYEQIKPAR
jgi:hypothetical protein